MHDLGQSSMEYAMNEMHAPGAGGSYETAFAGESPLHEILGHEAPMHESAEAPYHEYHEAPYHESGEAPFHEYHESGEAPYHEYHESGEAPYHEYHESGEAPYHEYHESGEAPYHEYHESGEAPFHEYHEAPYHESGEAPYHEYHEAAYQEAATFESGEAPFGEMHAMETGETMPGSWNEALSEDEELALASEILEIQTEDELNRFLGKLFKRVTRGIGGFIRSPVGQMLGGVLKKIGRVALPLAGKALGTFVGGPFGAVIGGQLANVAGQALGLELQEMSPPEADFAAARQFVRFAAEMLRRGQIAPPGASPGAVVRQAVQGAAQQLAPGLLSRQLPRLPIRPQMGRRRGIWVRRGQTITLYGA